MDDDLIDTEARLERIVSRMIELENRSIDADCADEVMACVDEFSELAVAADNEAPRLAARILMERGMALMELGRALLKVDRARSNDALAQSAASYELADQLFELGDEPLRRGKMYFNYGNTLALMNDRYDGTNADLIRYALNRYGAARKLFEEHDSSLIPRVEQMVGLLDLQGQLVDMRSEVAKKVEAYRELIDDIRASGLTDDVAIRQRFGVRIDSVRS